MLWFFVCLASAVLGFLFAAWQDKPRPEDEKPKSGYRLTEMIYNEYGPMYPLEEIPQAN